MDNSTPWQLALDGMDTAAMHAGPEWAKEIGERAMIYALHHKYFTVDDINRENPDCKPPHPNAWGSRTAAWVRMGFCKKTGKIVTAKSKNGHCHKLCLLESLIYEKE